MTVVFMFIVLIFISIEKNILQPWTIVVKSSMSLVTGFLDPPLITDSANNLKLCWRRTPSLKVLARVKKVCKSPLRYTRFFISNTVISSARLKLAKKEANSKQHSEVEAYVFENYSHSSFTSWSKNRSTYF